MKTKFGVCQKLVMRNSSIKLLNQKNNQNFCNSIAVKEYKNEPNNKLDIKKKELFLSLKFNFQIIKLFSDNILTYNH